MTVATSLSLPIEKLSPGKKTDNARKAGTSVDGLAVSIKTHGLLMPLIVRNGGDSYRVVAGNRRLLALQLLAKSKEWTGPVPCIEVPHGSTPLEVSMVENLDREDLHPVDVFEVYAELIGQGMTVDELARRRNTTVQAVRQSLALGSMAPQVREAWRAGTISAVVAEAFTLTRDHKAQAAALKKVGKHPSAWQVRRELAGNQQMPVSTLLMFVGRAEYEKAGHEVNATLFNSNDECADVVVSDSAALNAMAARKLSDECDRLTSQDGWKWAFVRDEAPKDAPAWKRVYPERGQFAEAAKAEMGCLVQIDPQGKLLVDRGYIKPGDKVSLPKTPAEKKEAKKAAAERAERKEETGGVSNALAFRLSQQLTLALREALVDGGIKTLEEAVAITIAALACVNTAMPFLRLHGSDHEKGGRGDNDFAKYLKLARGKTMPQKGTLLLTWLARAIDLTCHDGATLMAALHPDKGADQAARLIAGALVPKALTEAVVKNFDAADYFASVSKEMILQAVDEALGKEHTARVAKLTKAEAAKYATAHVPKTGWVPEAMRL